MGTDPGAGIADSGLVGAEVAPATMLERGTAVGFVASNVNAKVGKTVVLEVALVGSTELVLAVAATLEGAPAVVAN